MNHKQCIKVWIIARPYKLTNCIYIVLLYKYLYNKKRDNKKGEVQGNEKVKGSGLKNKLGKNGKTKEKKVKKEVCLLFWFEIGSISCAYFIPIIVLKFQLKICVKTSAKTRALLSFFL